MTKQQAAILHELKQDATRTSQAIADLVGCHIKTVQTARAKYGYPGVSGTRVRSGDVLTSKQEIILKAVEANPYESSRAIGRLLDGAVSNSTIDRVRKNAGLPRLPKPLGAPKSVRAMKNALTDTSIRWINLRLRTGRTNARKQAKRYGVSVWTVYRLCDMPSRVKKPVIVENPAAPKPNINKLLLRRWA